MSKQYLSLVFHIPIAFLLGCHANMVGNNDGGVDEAVPLPPPKIPGCTGSCLVKNDCPVNLGPTTVKGVVNIPAGNLPLYKATVYIPTGDSLPGEPLTGANCDICDTSGLAFSTTTNDRGEFELKNIPSGSNIPLIVSVGKWRRTVTLPAISDCTTTTLEPDKTRLPRNRFEGNIPKIALSTGGYDALECLLRSNKLGLDDGEFTNPSGPGRVNLYSGGLFVATGNDSRGAVKYNPALGGADFPTSNPWWDSAENLSKYDIVLLSCEGREEASIKSAAAHQAMHTYLNRGGRVFASHWHNIWFSDAVQLPNQPLEPPLSAVASFVRDINPTYVNDNGTMPNFTNINQGFAKGAALANWLQRNGATTTQGTLPVLFTRVTLAALNPLASMYPTIKPQSWVDIVPPTMSPPLANPASQYFSVNTPLAAPDEMKCGQMVFTDLHVSGTRQCKMNCPATPDTSLPVNLFPDGCKSTSLSPQEKALIFMLFDLTNCIERVIG